MNGLTPQVILGLARGFMESRILLTGAELDLFTLLAPAALSAREIAAKIGGDSRALTILLDALCALGFLEKHGDAYRTSKAVSSLLSANNPDSILPLVLHMAALWCAWSGLTDRVRGIQKAKTSPPPQEKEDLSAFIGAMHAIAKDLAPAIVQEIGTGGSRKMIDVGGGSGTYIMAFLRAAPGLQATLFDRPAVIEMARERLARAGMLDRVTLVPGDFYRDELPPGHDIALLSAIIHQNSPDENLALFGKIFRALLPGGRIVIRDHVMEPQRTRPKDGAVFAVNMLVNTPGGNTYTFAEIEAALAKAGFTRIRLLKKGERMDALVEAFKSDEG